MATILFDSNCLGWNRYAKNNQYFLKRQTKYLTELFNVRGYLYLNCVYETLGAVWNPDNVNVCYRANNGDIRFEIEPSDEYGSYTLKIYQ